MTATTRPARFDRLVFTSLAPAVLLPVAAAVIAVAVSSSRPADPDFDNTINSLIFAGYLAVLLGSMTLNAWLLLRHPSSLVDRALPRHLSVLLTALYALVIVWTALFVALPIGGASLVFGAIVAAVSIAICVAALVRRGNPVHVPARAAVALTRPARIVSVGYVVIAGLVLLATLVTLLGVGEEWSQGAWVIGGPLVWALLVLGLPWSWPLYAIGIVLGFAAGSVLRDGAQFVQPVLMGLAVSANIVIAASVAWSSARRTAITNWFFRLTPRVFVAVDVPADDAATRADTAE